MTIYNAFWELIWPDMILHNLLMIPGKSFVTFSDVNAHKKDMTTAVAASAAFVLFLAEISGATTPLITPSQPPGAGT